MKTHHTPESSPSGAWCQRRWPLAVKLAAKLGACALGLGLLASGPARAATDVESPQGYLKGELQEAPGSIRRVAIVDFIVQYVTTFGLEIRKSNNTFYAKWDDLPRDALQASTDALYQQLATELQAAGLEVVPANELAEQPAMAELAKVGRVSFATVNDTSLRKTSHLISAKGLPIIVSTVPDQKVPKVYTNVVEGTYSKLLLNWERQSTLWLISNGETFNLATIYGATARLANAVQATSLSVRLTVPVFDLGIAEKPGGLFGMALGNSFEPKDQGKVQPNPRFVEGGSVFTLSTPDGPNPGRPRMLVLQKPVPIQGLDFQIGAGEATGSGGLVGALFNAVAGDSDKADFILKLRDPATLQPAMLAAGAVVFKEFAQAVTGRR